ncbi:MAG: hypothetical protein GX444_20380 [Myxococcales bacterium]|nr:hypothetical protein [Myxococcales bacterium]
MSEFRLPRAAWALLSIHLVLTASLALDNPHVHLLDDAFYTLTVARNLAAGQGFSYGGFPTNGVQPLLAFLAVPFMALAGDRPETALRLMVLLMALCSTALLWLLMRLAREAADGEAAIAAGVLYTANANLLTHDLSGLETPLHALLFWLCVWIYPRIRDGAVVRRWLGLGLLLGLLAYARFDAVFLFLAIAIDLAWRHRRRPSDLVRRGLWLFAPAGLLLAPWFVWSRLACGSFFQSSGAFHRWRGLLRQGVPDSLLGEVKFAVAKWVSLVAKLLFEPLWGYEGLMRWLARSLLGVERMQAGFLVQVMRQRPAAGLALVAGGAAVAFILIWFGRRHLRRLGALRPYAFVLLAVAGAAIFYPLYLLNYSMRHFYPYSVGMALVWGVWLSGFAAGAPRARKLALGAAAAVLGISLALPGVRLWLSDARPVAAWKITDDIRRAVPPGASIGYTDCGIYGYYLPEYNIVNLDGILNFEALQAMKEGDIGAYLERHRVRYVLYLHNFQAEFADQWNRDVAPRVEPVDGSSWLFRMKE